MKKTIARILATVALVTAGAASLGCVWILLDEPNTPKSLLD